MGSYQQIDALDVVGASGRLGRVGYYWAPRRQALKRVEQLGKSKAEIAHVTRSVQQSLTVNSSKTYAGASLPPDKRNTGWQWPTEWHWPTDIRKLMCWIFLGTSLQYINISLKSIPSAVHQQSSLPFLHILLLAPTLSVLMALVSGMSSWTIWKGKASAKGWAIAASLIYVLIFVRQFIIPLRPNWDHYLVELFTGIVGLAAFLWPDKQVGE